MNLETILYQTSFNDVFSYIIVICLGQVIKIPFKTAYYMIKNPYVFFNRSHLVVLQQYSYILMPSINTTYIYMYISAN